MKKLVSKFFGFIFLCLLTVVFPLQAFEDIGTMAFDFLNLPNSAKYAGIGECSMGMIGDPFALFSNPAGLKTEIPKLGCTYTNYIAGIQGGCGAYVMPIMGGTFGAGMSYLNYGKIPWTDISGKDLGSFSSQSLMPILGYGKTFGNSLVGVSAKAICEIIEEYRSIGIAGSIGYLFYPKQIEGLALGGTLQNYGKQLTQFNMTKEYITTFVRLGASYSLFNKLVQASAEVSLPYKELIFGVEWMPSEMIAIRGGHYSWGKDLETGKSLDVFAGFSLGFGFKMDKLSLDYAATPKGELGMVNRISLTYLFPKNSEKKIESNKSLEETPIKDPSTE